MYVLLNIYKTVKSRRIFGTLHGLKAYGEV